MNNDECNPECRTNACAFDYCDCFDGIEWSLSFIDNNFTNATNATLMEYEQCSFNWTLCEIKSDCIAFDTNISESWIGDNICDDYCNNKYCDFDNGECKECADSGCQTFWVYFDQIANIDTQDCKISAIEMCAVWDLFLSVLNVDVKTYQYNCTEFVDLNDENDDNLVNGFEAAKGLYRALNDETDEIKLDQLNCSLCWPNVEIYYS